MIDASFAAVLVAGTDIRLAINVFGTTATVSMNGALVGSFSYYGAVADGGLGVISAAGTTSFDDVSVVIGTRVSTSPDSQAPTLTVPSNVTRSADAGVATAYVSDGTIGSASATDNVPGVVVTRSGVPAGNVFAIGVTTITWTATDVFGNQTVETQTITVTDTQKPTLSAPPNVTRTLAVGSTSIVVTNAELGVATASDNSGSVTITRSGVPAGNLFQIGATTITYTATDPSGNTETRTQTVTVTGTLPTVSITALDGSGSETGSDPIVFSVTRSGSTSATLTINVTWSGTAVSADYTVSATGASLSGSVLTFSIGSSTATITMTPVDDTIVEGTESVTLTLTSGSGYAVGSPPSASGSITDNDTASTPQITISDASIVEGKSKSKNVTVTVRLSAASSTAVTVAYATANGTATSGSDYAAKTGTLTIAAGQTTATISFTVYGDPQAEPDETFFVNLSNPLGATIADAQGAVTIINDDGAALIASAAPPSGVATGTLTVGQLESLVKSASALWATTRTGSDLSGITVTIADLDGLVLAIAGVDSITIDADAAGWGWTISGGQMDLQSVLLHEFGHALGYEHTDFGLMAATIEPGTVLSLEALATGASSAASTHRSLAGTIVEASRSVEPTSVAVGAVANSAEAIIGIVASVRAASGPSAATASAPMAMKMFVVSLDARSFSATVHTAIGDVPARSPSGQSSFAMQLAVLMLALVFVRRRRSA